MAAPAIPLVLETHAEDAAILWLQRDRAVDAPHFNPRLLERLEERLEAHVDGLRVAGEPGWAVAQAALARYGEPGEVFAAAVLALEGRQPARIEAVLAAAASQPAAARALVSAMGWIGARHLQGTVAGLMADPRPERRTLGVAACSVHRVDPGSRLVELLLDAPPVRARALRLAGELGRADLARGVADAAGDADPAVSFRAAWAAGLLGERRTAIPALQREVEAAGRFRAEALQLVLRIMDRAAAMAWLRDLGRVPSQARVLVEAAGILGDPGLVPWLLRCMEDPALARAAGESFAMITGADLALEDLDGDAPAGLSFGPNDDPADPDVALDPDEDLPWPDPALIRDWWQARAQGFAEGRRYLLGRDLSDATLAETFRTGFQRQRRAAALEQAVRAPTAPLTNWRAPVAPRPA